MKFRRNSLATALSLASLTNLCAQYAPPPPPAPFPGFLNEYLRSKDPYMNQWDFGGNVRLRYEVKEGFGIPGVTGSFDWNNSGRLFDAAKLRWQNEWFSADFFTSRPVIPEDGRFNVENDYDWFSGVYATSGKVPKNTLEVYFLARNASAKAAAA